MARRAGVLSVVPSCWPGAALACSGPGAMEAIERAERIGWQLFGATLGLAAIAALMLRRWKVSGRRLAWVALPVVVHPGWWLTARGGDCGATRLMGSIDVTAVAVVALLVAVVLTGLRHHRAAQARRR